MAELGINVARDASSHPETLRLMGARWLRVVAYPSVDLARYIRLAHNQGMKVLVVIARESLVGTWAETLAHWRALYPEADAWQPMNEPDAGWDPGSRLGAAERAAGGEYPSSWCVDPDEVTGRLREARLILGPVTIVGPGLCSGHPEYMDLVDWSTVDAVAIHPYAKEPETPELNRMIAAYKRRADGASMRLWVTEYDSRTRGMHRSMAQDTRIVVATAFCHDDRTMVPDFGMIDLHGRIKPSYTEFVQAAGLPVPRPEEPVMAYDVGPGILDAMRADGTQPATDGDFWPPRPKEAQVERAYGMNGTEYTYLRATNLVYRRKADGGSSPVAWAPTDLRGTLPVRAGAAPYPWRDIMRVDSADIHYTAGSAAATAADVARYQTGPNSHDQFPEIAYHLYVEQDGGVLYVQDLGKRVWGSPAPGRNERSVHICYAGDREPNPAQKNGIRKALRWVQEQLGRTVAVSGHKDHHATQCPGPTWPTWKAEVLP